MVQKFIQETVFLCIYVMDSTSIYRDNVCHYSSWPVTHKLRFITYVIWMQWTHQWEHVLCVIHVQFLCDVRLLHRVNQNKCNHGSILFTVPHAPHDVWVLKTRIFRIGMFPSCNSYIILVYCEVTCLSEVCEHVIPIILSSWHVFAALLTCRRGSTYAMPLL